MFNEIEVNMYQSITQVDIVLCLANAPPNWLVS